MLARRRLHKLEHIADHCCWVSWGASFTDFSIAIPHSVHKESTVDTGTNSTDLDFFIPGCEAMRLRGEGLILGMTLY